MMAPRCPSGGTFARRIYTRPDGTEVTECPACGRVVKVNRSGRLRIHGIASSYQPSLMGEKPV